MPALRMAPGNYIAVIRHMGFTRSISVLTVCFRACGSGRKPPPSLCGTDEP
jgi:hypothetical protein